MAKKKTSPIPCSAFRLPPEVGDEEIIAASLEADPRNAVWAASAVSLALMPSQPNPPQRIAVLIQKLWDKATVAKMPVSFLGRPSAELKRKTLHFANELNKGGAAVEFVESSNGLLRVAFDPGDGHYSYLGTDNKLIKSGEKTMNLELDLNSPESEWWRVCPHEFGHALGFPHEHARKEIVELLDPAGCYAEFARYGWSRSMVDQQVLTPLDQRSIMGTPSNVNSLMCYQFPARCTKNRKAIVGGTRPTSDDLAFTASLFPGTILPPPPPPPPPPGTVKIPSPNQRWIEGYVGLGIVRWRRNNPKVEFRIQPWPNWFGQMTAGSDGRMVVVGKDTGGTPDVVVYNADTAAEVIRFTASEAFSPKTPLGINVSVGGGFIRLGAGNFGGAIIEDYNPETGRPISASRLEPFFGPDDRGGCVPFMHGDPNK